MAGIGSTLREARIRSRIDISEIEAKTKIRAKYLRALENEEWGLLPGSTYTKSFLRAYAQALGLDGRALVEAFREQFERDTEREARHPPLRSHRNREREPSPKGYLLLGTVLGLVALLAIIGSLSGGGAAHHHSQRAVSGQGPAGLGATAPRPATTVLPAKTSLALKPTARIWVCLVAEGKRLIPGRILVPEEGEATPPRYEARSFKVNLGNSHVKLIVDGRPQAVPSSPEPLGYVIEGGRLKPLAPPERPTCG